MPRKPKEQESAPMPLERLSAWPSLEGNRELASQLVNSPAWNLLEQDWKSHREAQMARLLASKDTKRDDRLRGVIADINFNLGLRETVKGWSKK